MPIEGRWPPLARQCAKRAATLGTQSAWDRSTEEQEEYTVSLEITLRVNGLEHSTNGPHDPLEKLVKFLQDLGGVLVVRYDSRSGASP